MSRSGVICFPDCVPTFQELKIGKTLTYIIFKISDDKKSIIADKKSTDSNYESFLKDLPEKECRYAVYDFKWEINSSEGKRNKIVFVLWSPDSAPIKSKMLYTTSVNALRSTLTGIGSEVQATDFSEISHETVLEKVAKVTKPKHN